MLVVAHRGREAEVAAICERWELTSAVIGRVTDDGMYRVRWGAEVVAEIPGKALVDEAPVYQPEAREGAEAAARRARPLPAAPADPDLGAALEGLLDLPTIASKRWVHEQYDTSVQTNTVLGPGGDAAVLRVRGTTLGIAVTSGGNGRHVFLDPFEGGKAVVAEAARNLAVTGARPLAVTDCLNFGDPEKPDVFFQFREACRGIGEACVALGTPVVSGNVSFYNERPGAAVYPTPMIGMVGVLADVARRVPAGFQRKGDTILVLGHSNGALGGSQYLSWVSGEVYGTPPRVDLAAERALVDFLVEAAGRGLLRSAHDVSEGGLAVALVESALAGPDQPGFGAELSCLSRRTDPLQLLFAEDHARAVVSADPVRLEELRHLAAKRGVAAQEVGRVGAPGDPVWLGANGSETERPLARLAEIYERAIPRRMERAAGD
jgi:phosphoribosylformylglycinamidine synthase